MISLATVAAIALNASVPLRVGEVVWPMVSRPYPCCGEYWPHKIAADGTITPPYLGRVAIAGLIPTQAAKELQERWAEIEPREWAYYRIHRDPRATFWYEGTVLRRR